MSSGFWVLDSGWVVGLGLFGRIWATDFGFEVGLVIIGIRSGGSPTPTRRGSMGFVLAHDPRQWPLDSRSYFLGCLPG